MKSFFGFTDSPGFILSHVRVVPKDEYNRGMDREEPKPEGEGRKLDFAPGNNQPGEHLSG